MGLLDDLLSGAMGGAAGQQGGGHQRPAQPGPAGAGMAGVMAALLPVVLSMLANRGGGQGQAGGGQGQTGGGGLGDILGQVLGGAGASRQGGGGGGGGLGDILGQVLGGAGGGQGGLGGLLEQMQRSGLGDQARSWVGTGQNEAISPDQIGQIFGEEGVDEIARRAGISPQQASEGLSELLPEVVDRVTPEGRVPDLDQLARSVESLGRRLS